MNLKFISLIFAIGLYILYVNKLLFATMNRRLIFRDACAQLGIAEEDVYDDSNGEQEEEEVGEVEDALLELQTDEEEKTAVDYEGDVKVFVEGESDSSDDEEEPVNRESDDEQDDDWVVSPSGILYTSQPIPTRRRQRNIITEAPRAIAQPQNEKESFECLVSEEIFRTIFLHTNRKLREIQRTLYQVRYPTSMFSMDELKAGIAIMLRAGCDRDNFTDLRDLWKPNDSRPFYRTVMSLNRIKLLLQCILMHLTTGIHVNKERLMTSLLLFQKYGKFFFETQDAFTFLENVSPWTNNFLDTEGEFQGERTFGPNQENMV